MDKPFAGEFKSLNDGDKLVVNVAAAARDTGSDDDMANFKQEKLMNGTATDTESNNSRQNNEKSKPNKWTLVAIVMSLCLVIAVGLVSFLLFTILSEDDRCPNQHRIKQSNYKLFATKTAYSTAQDFIQKHQALPFDDKYPNIFSDNVSLEELHQRLLATGSSSPRQDANKSQGESPQCKALQFHFFGRHAARFPSEKNINEFQEGLKRIQAKLDAAKIEPSVSDGSQQPVDNATQSDGVKVSNNNCSQPNPMSPYLNWDGGVIKPYLDNTIMHSGFVETKHIASRFKSLLPEMFDNDRANITLATTSELRTAQTAVAFFAFADNYTLKGGCSHKEFAKLESEPLLSADSLKAHPCYTSFIKEYANANLSFHDICNDHNRSTDNSLGLKQQGRTNFIAESLTNKLKLTDPLTGADVHYIYQACRFETALQNSSIWCDLFEDSELRFLEYIEDLKYYYNQVREWKQTCFVTDQLSAAIVAAAKRTDSRPSAQYHFTHSEVIQKLLATVVHVKEPKREEIKSFLSTGRVPSNRDWRVSLIAPFSANLAFIVYECSESEPTGAGVLNVGPKSYKIVAALNERPIMLGKCGGQLACDLDNFKTENDFRRSSISGCTVDEVCNELVEFT